MSSCMRTRAGVAIALIACAVALDSGRPALAQGSARAPAASGAAPARAAPSAAHNPAPSATLVDQPRGTGYFVGDKVTQRVLLESAGRPVSPVSLPAPGRVSAWFERRA